MARRPQGTNWWTGGAASAAIFSGRRNVYSIFINARGVTAGNRVVFYDGTDATGTVVADVIFNGTNTDGISVALPEVGLQMATGLFFSRAGTPAGEINVTVGWDG